MSAEVIVVGFGFELTQIYWLCWFENLKVLIYHLSKIWPKSRAFFYFGFKLEPFKLACLLSASLAFLSIFTGSYFCWLEYNLHSLNYFFYVLLTAISLNIQAELMTVIVLYLIKYITCQVFEKFILLLWDIFYKNTQITINIHTQV